MRNLVLLFISLIPLTYTYSQYLHTPKDIKNLMQKSSNHYIVDSIGLQDTQKSYLNHNSFEETLAKPTELVTKPKAEKYLLKGNKNYKNAKYQKAVKYYEKALALEPKNTLLLKSMSKAQIAQHAYEEGISYLLQITEKNPLDFDAHLKLANSYNALDAEEKALRHISIAHLLNRNDSTTLAQLKDIYTKFGLQHGDWSFSPPYEISKVDQQIHISYATDPALAYASCKAIWLFETGYREKMKQLSNDKIEIIEEKECLLNALISFENMPKAKQQSKALKFLGTILPKGKVNDFINYEIISRENPNLFASFNQEEQNQLIDYLVSTRTERKE